MHTVLKIGKAYAVLDWRGHIVIAYKSKNLADQFVKGLTAALHNAAEDENARRDGIKAYLAKRTTRAPYIKAQLELF